MRRNLPANLVLVLAMLAIVAAYGSAHAWFQCQPGYRWHAPRIGMIVDGENADGSCEPYDEGGWGGGYGDAACSSSVYCHLYALELQQQGACPPPAHLYDAWYSYSCYITCGDDELSYEHCN